MNRESSELSVLWWGVFPPLVMIAVVVGNYFAPPLYELMTVRDEVNPYGIIENGTILVMLPAIVAGFIVFLAPPRLAALDDRLGRAGLCPGLHLFRG